jgi:alpha-tubulin suppressor-like RCC1 family protein
VVTSQGVVVTGLSTIEVGGQHSCATTGAGIAMCWGYNNYGQLGDGTTTNRSTPVNVPSQP